MKSEEILMSGTSDLPEDENNASDNISHLRNYYGSAGGDSLAEALNALNSLDSLLKALEMTVEDLAEMCGEDEDEDNEDANQE